MLKSKKKKKISEILNPSSFVSAEEAAHLITVKCQTRKYIRNLRSGQGGPLQVRVTGTLGKL